jgi:hypothetical protein
MDIKEKQAIWLKEKPLFEAELIHSHLLPFFNFNENTGDYEIKTECVANADKEDQKVAYETLNTGWAMWLRAKRTAKAQVQEGFVLVPKTITDEWMGPFVVRLVCDYVEEYKGLPFEVKDSEIPGIEENYRWPIRQAHEKLMKVIEAQEQGQ